MHKYELPIARNTQVYVNSQRTKPPYARELDFCFFTPPDQALIPAETCDTFFSLVEDGTMPAWVIALAPVDELEKNKQDKPTQRPRLWMSLGLALIAPKSNGEYVNVGMAIMDAGSIKTGVVTVWDADSDEAIDVIIESTENSVETELCLEIKKTIK